MTKFPRSWYGPNLDGRLDPEQMTAAERAVKTPERAGFERDRRRSPSPVVRALQAATDRTFGGGR